ncbi:uncharacterized protein LOC112510829 isoform X2 [Cynara cardunculus var. scolymus]|uniref:uncharacterized protein LOC112510829 isoform X2 n=1 Tax=Cynara cardunculus var. scolymus TaxID=59895 RepID=UPI000D62AFC8|nr:uncharacterized protein LOC112510829 isoform X2 [Cynara cardunculus var. scolymus]
MGEGEVCVAVVSNVGEMENEKIQQKRDHQWLTAGSDVEPLAKKQAKEGSVDEGDSCARDLSEVAQVSIEHDPCVKRLPIEGSNDIKPEPCVEQNMNECSDGLELEPCGRMQTPEALKDIKPNTFVKDPVQQCLNATKQPNCERTQAIESLNYIGVNPCDEQPVKEDPCAMEVDPCGERLPSKVLNDIEIEPIVVQPVKECLNEMELESHGRMQGTGAGSDIDLDPCGRMQTTGARSDIEPEPSLLQPVKECPSETELEACGNMQPAEALNESEQELSVQQPVKESMHEMELEVCGRKQTTQVLDSTGIELSVVKQTTQALDSTGIELSVVKLTTEALNDIDLELSVEKVCHNEIVTDPCTKKEVKEASNDDICSEVSNPNVSPRDNSSSFQTVNSQSDGKVVMKDQVVCGEITSACSGDSSSEGSSSQEEHGTNDTSGTVSTSHVILEVPKHASTSSGIRKITFKFSKRKEDYGSQLSASAAKCMSEAFDNPTRKGPRLTHISEQGLHEPGEVMPGKVIPDSYPTTVKRLLSTGILEGAKVKYISASGELIGIVKDCGYLCGCATCNFSNILRAHEFEEHAGGKTRHPNNHIYLENGKPIYSIIQAMKTAPLSTVDEAIRNVAGSSVNEELLQVWKGNLQRNMDMAKPDNSYHMKLMNLYHSTTRPRSYTPSATVETKRSAEGGHKKRDNDLHRLLFMPNGLPDGTELAYYARGKKILDGYKQGNGIVCSHCDNEISPSQFEAHAGWAAKRQPYRHIYISNGVTLHDIALLLANGQSIATSNSDDMCAVCGDRGELIICDGCPHAFHSVCLGQEGVPSEDWHCPYCRDSIGSGRKTASESRPILIRLTRVVKAREYETGGCVICRAHDFSTAEFDDRTVMLCDQCEKEYHVGCLRESGICDLKALPSDKWFCCDHCDMIHGAIQEVVANGAAGISGLALSTINKKHIEKGVFDGSLDEIRWRMLSGKSRYPEHLPLLSRAAAIFRECFDPIVAKSGRDLIPVMVYGRNISGQEFGGIYCVVLMVGSVVVSAGLLRIFGREVAELPLVATSRQHQGKGYFQALFFCIEELLLSLGVEILVLPAAEEAESIWTKKLGFRKMSDERYSQYSRDIQLTIFKGTSMLEKELRHVTL